MAWIVDPQTGFEFYVDDGSGTVVTPNAPVLNVDVFTEPPPQPAAPATGIIAPTGPGTYGLIPFSDAPQGIDLGTPVRVPIPGTTDGSTALVPTIIPRGPYELDPDAILPYTPPIGHPAITGGPDLSWQDIKKVNQGMSLELLMLLIILTRRH